MACFHPLTGYRAPGGAVTFSRREGFIDLPSVTVSCGQCIGCRLERSRQWATRVMHESQLHEANSFITLTYDEEHRSPDHQLHPEHFTNFVKRFRNAGNTIRYFQCGEYGDQKEREHHHACVFGQDWSHDRYPDPDNTSDYPLYRSPSLETFWEKGRVIIGELTFQSAAYVARYTLKKVTGLLADEHYTRPDLETGEMLSYKRPYVTMSRRPGIGADWYSKYKTDVYPHDYVVTNGKKSRPPKFYDSLLEAEDPEAHAKLKSQRVQAGTLHEKDNTWERRRDKEFIQYVRANQLQRRL